MIGFSNQTVMCWEKCLTTVPLGEGKPWFVEFANFHVENTPTVADLKLLMWCHWMLSLEEMCTVVSQEAKPAGTAPTVEYQWYPLSHKALALASKRKPPDQAGTCHGRTQTEPTDVYLINQHLVIGDSPVTLLEALRTQSWSPKPRLMLTFKESAF